MRIAGIDQGTTATKGVVLDEDGRITALPASPHRQIFPQPGWVEHDPRELLANVQAALEAGAALGAECFGLANQGETVVAWDRDTGVPLAHAIVWQDQRTAMAVERMARDGHATEITAISGLPLDCYFSGSKLRWLLDYAPGARALARRGRLGLGTVDAYFIERLTGRYATDVTTASRTSLMNLAECRWDNRLCDLFGVPVETLPEIAEGPGPIGETRTAGGGKLDLMAGAVDQVAALYGHGCRKIGSGKVTVGTGAFALIVASDGPPGILPKGSVPTAAWRSGEGRIYAADGGVYSAAAAVEWLIRAGVATHIGDFAELPLSPRAAQQGLVFVPALSGLAFPHWDRRAAGLFIGLDAGSTREDMCKAVLEGIAFRIAEVLDGLGFAAGAQVPIDGGLSRIAYFTRFLADVSGRPLLPRGDAEMTSLGVAQLAAANVAGRDPAGYAGHHDAAAAEQIDPELPASEAMALRARFADALERAKAWRQ